MSQNSSEKLLKRYQQGSDTAPLEIHRRYQDRLIRLAQKRLQGVLKSKFDADDVAQEAFATFFAMADSDDVQWRAKGDLWRLLAGITINKVKQQLEHYSAAKRDPRTESKLDQTDGQFSSHDVEGEARELAELVEHLLVSEKPLVGSVLKLRLAGWTFEEISIEVGRSTRTIRRLLESLKAKLVAGHDLKKSQTPKGSQWPADSLAQQVDYNDFHLLRMIGQGSFAKVYLAIQISSGNHFAVKAIKKKWIRNQAARDSFFNEVSLLMSLSDSSFVKTYGIGHLPNGGCFLVLQWIDGVSLAKLVGSASHEQRVVWIEEIRKAVSRLHAANIAHGDICASNVMIDSQGSVTLLDFGLGTRFSVGNSDFESDVKALERLSELVLSNN